MASLLEAPQENLLCWQQSSALQYFPLVFSPMPRLSTQGPWRQDPLPVGPRADPLAARPVEGADVAEDAVDAGANNHGSFRNRMASRASCRNIVQSSGH